MLKCRNSHFIVQLAATFQDTSYLYFLTELSQVGLVSAAEERRNRTSPGGLSFFLLLCAALRLVSPGRRSHRGHAGLSRERQLAKPGAAPVLLRLLGQGSGSCPRLRRHSPRRKTGELCHWSRWVLEAR